MAKKPLSPDAKGGTAGISMGRVQSNAAAANKRTGAGSVAKSSMDKAKAQALRGYILRKGGVTLNTKTMNPVSPKRGYSVGVAPKTATKIGAGRATPGRVTGAFSNVAQKYNPKNLGAWFDKGQIHIDPVKIVKSYGKAQNLGRKFNQESIYSFTSGKTLRVLRRGK